MLVFASSWDLGGKVGCSWVLFKWVTMIFQNMVALYYKTCHVSKDMKDHWTCLHCRGRRDSPGPPSRRSACPRTRRWPRRRRRPRSSPRPRRPGSVCNFNIAHYQTKPEICTLFQSLRVIILTLNYRNIACSFSLSRLTPKGPSLKYN